VKRRQYLLLARYRSPAFIVGAALLSVSLTGSRQPDEQPSNRSPPTSSPRWQVDPKDAWRGQADAQLKASSSARASSSQRNAELEGQNKEMLERLKKLEQTGLTPCLRRRWPLPPPGRTSGRIDPGIKPLGRPQRLRPSRRRRPHRDRWRRAGPFTGLPPPPAPRIRHAARPPASSASCWPTSQRARPPSRPRTPPRRPILPRDTRRYLPSGAFTRAVLLGGLDAPTGGQAQRNPQPVLLRLVDNAVLPNHFRSK
jgi:conjugal transfer pilus assembly protein TraB